MKGIIIGPAGLEAPNGVRNKNNLSFFNNPRSKPGLLPATFYKSTRAKDLNK